MMSRLKIQLFVAFGLFSAFNAAKLHAAEAKLLEAEGGKVLKKLNVPSKLKTMEKRLRERESTRQTTEDALTLGLWVQFGSGSTYGNGFLVNVDVKKFFRIQVGLGYNSTGPKTGLGVAFVLPIFDSFGFDLGGAYGHSFGTKNKVSLQGRFTPEGSSQKESIEASRKFRISPGNYYSVYAGAYYALLKNIWLDFNINYNKYVNGHHVEFYEAVAFNKSVEVTNEESMQADFEKKARAKLDATGLGFSIGAQIRI